MMRNWRRMAGRAGRAGFTLIEIMLVVVIIGLIVGIALPKLSGHTNKARIMKAESEIKNIGMAIRLYEMDVGSFPPGLDALATNPGAKGWKGPYLESGAVPKDPWGNDYRYVTPGTHGTDYDLSSLGKDGVESDDDITSWQKQTDKAP